MCGRFTLRSSPKIVAAEFGLFDVPDLAPRYNIAPGQQMAVIRRLAEKNLRDLAFVKWDLIPAWLMIRLSVIANARSETAPTKPSFRKVFRSRRCLLVADRFYEWQRTDGRKQPYYVRVKNDHPFGIAGLWERWEKGNEPIESCTIPTTDANDLMKPIHERMQMNTGPFCQAEAAYGEKREIVVHFDWTRGNMATGLLDQWLAQKLSQGGSGGWIL